MVCRIWFDLQHDPDIHRKNTCIKCATIRTRWPRRLYINLLSGIYMSISNAWLITNKYIPWTINTVHALFHWRLPLANLPISFRVVIMASWYGKAFAYYGPLMFPLALNSYWRNNWVASDLPRRRYNATDWNNNVIILTKLPSLNIFAHWLKFC